MGEVIYFFRDASESPLIVLQVAVLPLICSRAKYRGWFL